MERNIDDFTEYRIYKLSLSLVWDATVLVHPKSLTLFGSRGQGLSLYNTHTPQTNETPFIIDKIIKDLHSTDNTSKCGVTYLGGMEQLMTSLRIESVNSP